MRYEMKPSRQEVVCETPRICAGVLLKRVALSVRTPPLAGAVSSVCRRASITIAMASCRLAEHGVHGTVMVRIGPRPDSDSSEYLIFPRPGERIRRNDDAWTAQTRAWHGGSCCRRRKRVQSVSLAQQTLRFG